MNEVVMESQQRSQSCEHEVRQISSQLTDAQQVLDAKVSN